MSSPRRHSTPDLTETWERFKSARGRELQNWVEAEHALARARDSGPGPYDPGDRLLVAEAALQSAIIDFAAAQDAAADPTPVALGLLRLAESALALNGKNGSALRRPGSLSGRPRGARARRGDPQPG